MLKNKGYEVDFHCRGDYRIAEIMIWKNCLHGSISLPNNGTAELRVTV